MASPFNSTVELMANVPLTPDYQHTLTFTSYITQTSYFANKVVQTAQFTNLSYQRHNRGVIRLQLGMDLLDQVNYLRFQNRNYTGGGTHENKLFYAFITDMNYISDAVTEISYSIDVLQTWMFDYTVNPCFVEREHTNDDTLGKNLVDEGLDTGDLICQDMEQLGKWFSYTVDAQGNITLMNSYYLVVATQAPDGSAGNSIIGGVYHGLWSTIAGSTISLTNVLNSFVSGATGNIDPIMGIFMFPSEWHDSGVTPNSGANGTFRGVTFTLTKDQSVGVGAFKCYNPETGGLIQYSAKNKKLLTSPYNYIILESPDGNTVKLKYENFRNISNHIEFDGALTLFPYVETMVSPKYYECQTDTTANNGDKTIRINPEYTVSCKSYPTCGTASDAFMAWWAQNKFSMPVALAGEEAASSGTPKQFFSGNNALANMGNKLLNFGSDVATNLLGITGSGGGSSLLKTLSGGLNLGAGLLSGNPSSAIHSISSLSDDVGSQLAAYKGHQALPSTIATKAENAGIIHATNTDCYKVYYMRVKPEYAEIIDNYFSCFGYKTHIVKQPNVTGRQNWNYVKTVGCTISGNVPAEADEKIRAIYDKGVTFWHNPNTMFDYTQNNPIV